MVLVLLLYSEVNEDSGLRLLDGNVGDEDINFLDYLGGELDFDNDNELYIFWFLEDLFCIFFFCYICLSLMIWV